MFGRKRGMDMPAFGDAHPATLAEVRNAGLLNPRGIRLGYYREPGHHKGWGDVIRYGGDGGLITVAPPRTGKARDVLVAALLEYEQSLVVIDPKGQLASITKAKRERMGQKVIVLNPFNVWSDVLGPSASYNPMDLLDPGAPDWDADCRKLAEGLIAKGNAKDDQHWVGGARGLLTGVIGGLAAHGSDDTRNLAHVREIICNDTMLLRYAKASLQSPHAFIRQELSSYALKEPYNAGELSSFKQNAREQTSFLGMESMAANLRGSDFRFSGLKEGDQPTTVYIILPDNRLDVCGKWFRLIVASALDDLWRGGKGKHRILAVLDEFAAIGHLELLEQAAAAAAGRGVQLWPVIQNLPQLKKDYGEIWETFLSGAEIRMFFAPREQTSAEYISKLSGQRTVTTAGESVQNKGILGQNSESDSAGQAGQPLIRPHEICSFGENESLIIGPRNIVVDALRQPYFHTPDLEYMYAPDPMHRNDPAPPAPMNADEIVTFADVFAANEEQARTARRARRPLALRLLTWGTSQNPFVNALLKLEYFATLPLRLPLALLLAPFAIHNRPLGASVGFLALFGFWEIMNGFIKEPFLQINTIEQQKCVWSRYAHDNDAQTNSSMGHLIACRGQALRSTLTFFWTNLGAPLISAGPEVAAIRFDRAFDHEQESSHAAAGIFADHIVGSSIKNASRDFVEEPRRLTWTPVPANEHLGELRSLKPSDGREAGPAAVHLFAFAGAGDEEAVKQAYEKRISHSWLRWFSNGRVVIRLNRPELVDAPAELRYVLSELDEKPIDGYVEGTVFSNVAPEHGNAQHVYLVRLDDGRVGLGMYIENNTYHLDS